VRFWCKNRQVGRDADENTRVGTSFSTVHQKEVKPIVISGLDDMLSVALVDEKHVVNGGRKGEIRRWRIEDGEEVGESELQQLVTFCKGPGACRVNAMS